MAKSVRWHQLDAHHHPFPHGSLEVDLSVSTDLRVLLHTTKSLADQPRHELQQKVTEALVSIVLMKQVFPLLQRSWMLRI